MISQQGQTNDSTNTAFRIIQRLWHRIKQLCRRYAAWQEIKRSHDELLRMDDRMLRDIGLSRSDIRKIMRGHNFWRHMFRRKARERECTLNRKEEAVCNPERVQAHPASNYSLCSTDRCISRI